MPQCVQRRSAQLAGVRKENYLILALYIHIEIDDVRDDVAKKRTRLLHRDKQPGDRCNLKEKVCWKYVKAYTKNTCGIYVEYVWYITLL
jgi:hypothetical protein